MPTIREVAKHAGVSIGTVSKVLNGSDDRVDPASKERILTSIRKLRYKPPAFEQNQKSVISYNIGLIAPDLTEQPLLRNGYVHLLLDGILEVAALQGWSVTVFAEKMWDDVGNAVRRKYDGRCDCLIVLAPQPYHDFVHLLQRRGAPLVQVGSTPWLEDISSIDLDNIEVGRIVARHLLSLGHRRMLYVSNEKEQISSCERYEGFTSEIGEPVDKILLGPTLTDRQFAESFSHQGPDRATGIFCWHDGAAIELIERLAELGIAVPENVSVVGVDNSWENAAHGIALTTVDHPLGEIGRCAAAMAIERALDPNKPAQIVKLPPRLIAMSTSAPPPPSQK